MAPSIFVLAERPEDKKDEERIIAQARQMSGLGRFDEWKFVIN